MRKLKSRHGQRGAMMVEALIVLTFICIFFASGLFLFSEYNGKLESFGRATGQAFQVAASGCGTPFGTYNIATLINLTPPDPLSDNPDPAFLGGPISTTSEQVTFSGNKPVMLGGGGWTIGTTAKVACNEPPMTKAAALTALGVDTWSVDGVISASGF